MLSRQSFVTLAFALMLALLLIDWYSVDNGMAFQQSDVGKQVTVASSKPPSSMTRVPLDKYRHVSTPLLFPFS